MIQERFEELQPYLRGVKISGGFTIVESFLKDSWKLTNIVPDGVKITTKDTEEKGFKYYMLYSEDMTIDKLIDTLELVVRTNIEVEQKQALLRSKVEELKRMFEDKPLDELKSLKFSSDIDVTLNINKPEPPSQVTKEGEEPKHKSNGVTEKVQ